MTWLQTFVIVLVCLVWATVVVSVVLTEGNTAVVGLLTPPVMLVLGAAVGVPLRKIGEALKNGDRSER